MVKIASSEQRLDSRTLMRFQPKKTTVPVQILIIAPFYSLAFYSLHHVLLVSSLVPMKQCKGKDLTKLSSSLQAKKLFFKPYMYRIVSQKSHWCPFQWTMKISIQNTHWTQQYVTDMLYICMPFKTLLLVCSNVNIFTQQNSTPMILIVCLVGFSFRQPRS